MPSGNVAEKLMYSNIILKVQGEPLQNSMRADAKTLLFDTLILDL